MKKVIICSFIAFATFSCKKEFKEKVLENTIELSEDTLKNPFKVNINKNDNSKNSDSIIYTKLSIAEITKTLKNGDYSKEFAKYSDKTINEVAANMGYYMASGENGEEQLKEIISFKNDFISLYCSPGNNGPSDRYEKILVKDNKVVYLGNGVDKLTEIESGKLEKIVKSKINNFSHISFQRTPAEITIQKNGNYLINCEGLTEDDVEASGGSVRIIFETQNLKEFIENSVKVIKRT